MYKTLFSLLFLSLITMATPAYADNAFEPSATLKVIAGEAVDMREIVLERYLDQHNSPLSEYADVFIAVSDEYGLDWRLVPAITGVESTFGKRIPYNSYNAYGWANGAYSFSSWEESIGVVSKALSEKYIARGAKTTYQIGRIYAPPSPTWANKVEFFKNKIEPLPVEYAL